MAGIATVTIGLNAVVPFSYAGTGAVQPLSFGFIPSGCQFWGGTLSWAWVRGMGFGDAKVVSGTAANATAQTACVLDILDGSGLATTNTATSTTVIGLLIGTNTVVNNAGATYFGLAYR